jgi:DnaJ-class molecular chaperone
MTAASLTEPCPACSGTGTVPHQKRRMANGEKDPADFRIVELCERCGGGGRVPVNKAAIVEKQPGFIADSI